MHRSGTLAMAERLIECGTMAKEESVEERKSVGAMDGRGSGRGTRIHQV